MKISWTAATMLSAAFLAGCGSSTPENTQNFDQSALSPAVQAAEAPVTETAPAPQTLSPRQDISTAAPAPRSAVTRPTATPARPAANAAPGAAAYTAPAPPTAPASTSPAVPRYKEVSAPANTALALELLTAISSETAQVETPVRARLRQAVVIDGQTVLPAGAELSGNVIDVARAGRIQGRSRLTIRFTEVEYDGSPREDFRTNPVTFEGEATKGQDAAKIGAGAVGGAIIGGILGGGSGAAKGAAIGGAAGTGVVLATRGQEVTLAAGTPIDATLATPFYVQVPLQ